MDAIGAADKVDLYLLTAPDVAFVQDGFRDGEKIRDWMHEAFRTQLASGPTPWRQIAGPYAARFEAAETAVEALMESTLSSANTSHRKTEKCLWQAVDRVPRRALQTWRRAIHLDG